MKTQISVPMWILLFSAGLHLITVIGLVAMLVLPGLGPKMLTVIEVRVTATSEPIEATATAIPPTATVVQPTATAIPPTATRAPTATPVPCKSGEVPGVDCALDVDGVAVTVVSLERMSVYTVTVEEAGREVQIPYVPKDDVNDEFLVVHLSMPAGTVKDDLAPWFEQDGVHAPRLEDSTGNKVAGYSMAYVENDEETFDVVIIFVVPKDVTNLTLRIQGEARVDLSLVPDMTVEAEATPVSGGPSPTPVPTATSVFNP